MVVGVVCDSESGGVARGERRQNKTREGWGVNL